VELGVLGAVVGLADRVTGPANRVITSPGPGVSVTAPPLGRWRLQLDRTSRHVATEHYSSRRAPAAGQVDAHRCSLSRVVVPPCGPGRLLRSRGFVAAHPVRLTIIDATRTRSRLRGRQSRCHRRRHRAREAP
jgi:hypothetical protein